MSYCKIDTVPTEGQAYQTHTHTHTHTHTVILTPKHSSPPKNVLDGKTLIETPESGVKRFK